MAHQVHGLGWAMARPTWAPITAHEAEAVLAHFAGAGRLTQVCWHSPRPFSAAALLETAAGEFLLKRHDLRVRTPVMLAHEHRFIAHLRAAGLQVPELIIANDGQTSVALGDAAYELQRKAPGLDLYRDRQSWTPFLSLDHARAAGVALARLHLAARGFGPASRGADPLVASFTIVPSRDPVAAARDYVCARPALVAFLAGKPWQRDLARLFAQFGQGLTERLADQPPLWTHNDWHPSNLLWSADGSVTTVFDFGLATSTCALHDLATAIERSTIAWLDPGEGADAPAARALLAGYAMTAPLSSADIATVACLLPLVHVEFALSEVDYFSGIVGDCEQAEVAWQDYCIGHADWFSTPPGRAFLQDIVA